MRVVGVDGAPGGWAAVLFDTDAVGVDRWRVRFHETYSGMVSAYPHVSCIAVDVPIGLLEGGARQCDVEARKLLGPKRSSVFPAPDPRVFDSVSQKTASATLVELTGKGMTHQAFGILGKVAEVNRAMSLLLQNWIVEVHPELSFTSMAGSPVLSKKGDAEGYEERARLLSDAMGIVIPPRREMRTVAGRADPEDVLDALVSAWTAARIVDGTAVRIPSEPQIGTNGLRMQIAY